MNNIFQETIKEILKLAEICAQPLGLIVVDVRILQQGKRRILEVTIYRTNSQISLTDCEKMSRSLEETLDNANIQLLENNYLLEVQSPGLRRELKSSRELSIFQGERIEIKTKEKINGLGDIFNAKLVSHKEDKIEIADPRPIQIQAKNSRTKKDKQLNTGSNEEISQTSEILTLELKDIYKIQLVADEINNPQKENLINL